MDIAGLLITYKADIGQAKSGIADLKSQLSSVSDAAQSSGSGLSSAFKGIGSAISIIGDVAAPVFGFLKNQLGDSIKLAMEHQQVMSQTASAIKSTGDASGLSATQIGGLAESLSKVTPFSEDVTQSGENLLLTFTGIGKQVFPMATQAMLDMSQAMGQDTKSSAIQLGKALNDPLTGLSALQRVGVTFSDSEKQQIKTMMAHNDVIGAQKVMLKELNTEFGGSAVAAGKTFAGALAVLKNNLNDVKEKIGTALLPVLSQFAGFVSSNVMPALSRFGDWFSSTIAPALQQFGALVGQTVGPVVKQFAEYLSSPGFKEFASGVGQQLVQTFKDLGKTAMDLSPLANTIEGVVRHGQDLSDWFTNSVIPAVHQAEPGFRQLGDALSGLLPAFKQIGDIVHGSFQKAFDDLLPVFKQAVPIIIQIAGVLAGGLGQAIKFLTPYIVQAATEIGKFADQIATRVAPIAKGFFDELNKDMPMLKAIWNEVWPSLSLILRGTWDQIKGIIQIAWSVVKGIILVGLDLMSGNWKQAWEDMKDALHGVWDGIQSYFKGAIEILLSGFRPMFQLLAQIPGPWQDMAKSVLGTMDNLNSGVSSAAANMKIHTLQETAQMHMQSAQHFDQMRKDLIDKMNNTSDPVQKKVLEMKINSIQHMEDMQVQAGQKAAQMAQKVIGSSQNMSDQVVGHSIIPDMVNNVISWFAQLPGRAGAWVQTMSSTVMGILGGMASSAWTAGLNIVNQVAAGIQAGIGNVGAAIGQVTQFIADHLPHSPAKIGPLRDLPQAGGNITRQIGEGMLAAQPSLQAAMSQVVQFAPYAAAKQSAARSYTIRPSASSVAAAVQSSAGSDTGDGTLYLTLEIDSNVVGEMSAKYMDKHAKLKLTPGMRGGRVA